MLRAFSCILLLGILPFQVKILLLILFFPYFTPEKVIISGNEKEILFILGIVGIMHLGVLKL